MTDNIDNRLTAVEEKSNSFDDQLKRQQIEIADLQRRLSALEKCHSTDKDAEVISTIAERVEAIESKLTESEKPESSTTCASTSATTASKKLVAPVGLAPKPDSTLASEIEIPKTEAVSATKPTSSTASTASTVASKFDLPKTNQASLENVNLQCNDVIQLQNRIKKLEKEKKELLKHNKYNLKRKNELKDEVSRLDRELKDFQLAIIEVGKSGPKVDINLESVMGSEFDCSQTTQSGYYPKPASEIYKRSESSFRASNKNISLI